MESFGDLKPSVSLHFVVLTSKDSISIEKFQAHQQIEHCHWNTDRCQQHSKFIVAVAIMFLSRGMVFLAVIVTDLSVLKLRTNSGEETIRNGTTCQSCKVGHKLAAAAVAAVAAAAKTTTTTAAAAAAAAAIAQEDHPMSSQIHKRGSALAS
eukprot:160424-Amphidinium_carterae.1